MEKKRYFHIDNGEKEYFSDSSVELFKNGGNGAEPYKSIAREVIQNSIDAKNKECSSPLVVKFSFEEILTKDFPDLYGLKKHINGTIDYCESKLKNNIALKNSRRQNKVLEKEKLTILKISDFNTKGVTGSDDLNSGQSKWKGLVYNEGDNIKDSSDSLGSHGLGKNASFAITPLRTVFYVTRDKDNNYAMEGVAKLYTSYIDGKKYANEGYFCNEINGKTTPLNEEEALSVSSLFKRERNDFGTDIFVMAPNLDIVRDHLKRYLIESILYNFFMAFVDGQIEVIVDNTEINQNNLYEMYSQLRHYYEEHDIDLSDEMICLEQFLLAIENGEEKVEDLKYFGQVSLKLYKTEETKCKKVAIFREHGMLIMTRDVNTAQQKFAGVLVVKGKKGIQFLKDIEDPSHTKFDTNRETTDTTLSAKDKKDLLNDFFAWITMKARAFTNIETDGMITFEGMEDYIQMPDSGKISKKEKKDITVKKIKKSRKKDKQRIKQKLNVDTINNGLEIQEDPHKPDTLVGPNPDPDPNFYDPGSSGNKPNPESKKKGYIKAYNASFIIEPVMKFDKNKCMLIFKTDVVDKPLKIKVIAVGEDGKENTLLPKLIEAYDINNAKKLCINRGVVENVDGSELAKIELIYESDLKTRVKAIVYWEEYHERNK